MNSKLPYNEVVDAYRRKLKQAEYKAVSSQSSETRRKWDSLACLYESTLHFLTNRITNKIYENGQSGN